MILILGGNGMLGQLVAETLRHKGVNFQILSRNPDNDSPYSIKGDITDIDTIKEPIDKSDVVINLVGLSPLQPFKYHRQYERVHVGGVINILNCMNDSSKLLVHVCADIPLVLRWTEYSRTKLVAEKLIKTSSVRHHIIHPKLLLSKENEVLRLIRYKWLKNLVYNLMRLVPHDRIEAVADNIVAEALA